MADATEDSIHAFYAEYVEPVHADLIAVRKKRLDGVDTLVSKAFATLGSAKKGTVAEDVRTDLNTAYVFLLDAGIAVTSEHSLECSREARKIADDDGRRKWCARAPKEVVSTKFEEALSLHSEGTKNQALATVAAREKAVRELAGAIKAYRAWIELFDPDLLRDFGAFRLRQNLKQHAMGFVTGLVTSGIIAGLAWWLLPQAATERSSMVPPAANGK